MSIVNRVKVYGLRESVQASKYPMAVDVGNCTDVITKRTNALAGAPIGSGHDNFLNGVIIQFDLTFSVKAWVEAGRYHFLDFVSSQSTMHRITKFDLDKAYNEYVDKRIITVMKYLVEQYNAEPTPENYLKVLYSNPEGFRLTARMPQITDNLKRYISRERRTVFQNGEIYANGLNHNHIANG